MTDIAGLERLAEEIADGRGRAPFFVGREEDLERIRALVRTEPQRRADGWTNGITLFSGPPGSGKTALLLEGMRRASAEGESGKRLPLVVRTNPKSVESTADLMSLLAREVKDLAKARGLPTGLLAGGFEIFANYLSGSDALARNALERISEIALESRPVILLNVDEVQNSEGSNLDVYLNLYQGDYPLPIAAVFAGLSNSAEKLEAIGLSRLGDGKHVRLGALEKEDCRSAMRKLLDRYRIRVRNEEEWLEFAVDGSALFPKHLHAVILATTRTAIAGKGKELDAGDLAESRRFAEENRIDYYQSRSKNFSPAERWLATTVVSRVEKREADLHYTIRSVLEDETNRRNEQVRDLADHLDTDEFARDLVRKGMLQKYEDGVYEAPIPSFATWLRDNYGHFLAQEHDSATASNR